METQKGGLTVEEIWGIAWQVVEMLKGASHPAVTAKILLTRISGEIEEKTKDLNRTKAQNIHSTHCVLFCVNYLLCANAEEPDPNQDVIDSISEQLSQMPDIVELFEAVEREEDREEAKGHKMLDGASPQLCKMFYPNLKGDEYKAIDKGKNKEVQAFVKVEPLLETYLKHG